MKPYSYNYRKYYNYIILADYYLMVNTSFSNQSSTYGKVDIWDYTKMPPQITNSFSSSNY